MPRVHARVLGVFATLCCTLLIPALALSAPPEGHERIGVISPLRHVSGDVTVYLELEQGDTFFVRASSGEESGYVPAVGVLRVYDDAEELMAWHAWSMAADPNRFAEFTPQDRASLLGFEGDFIAERDGIYQVRLSGEGHFWEKIGGDLIPGLSVWAPPGRHWGVSQGMSGHETRAWEDLQGARDLYVWLPAHPTARLEMSFERSAGSQPFSLHREGSSEAYAFESDAQRHIITLEPERSGGQGAAWRLEHEGGFRFSTKGAQIAPILTDSPDFAERLGASLERIEAGPMQGFLVSHKAQKELAERIIPKLLEYVGEDAVMREAIAQAHQSEACQRPAELRDALTAPEMITQGLAHYEYSLLSDKRQGNLDQPSAWIGALADDQVGSISCRDDSWCAAGSCQAEACQIPGKSPYDCCVRPGFGQDDMERFALDLDEERWDLFSSRRVRYRHSATDSYGSTHTGYGFSPYAAMVHAVGAYLATHAHPCNPFGPEAQGEVYGERALLARAAISSMMNFLLIDEDERPLAGGSRDDGALGFQLGGYNAIYGLAAPAFKRAFSEVMLEDGSSLGERGYALWTQMARRISVDRHLAARISQNHNQSSDLLDLFAGLVEGLKGEVRPEVEPWRRGAELFVHRFVNEFERVYPHSPRFGEGWGGTDGTYGGRTHKAFAKFWMSTSGENWQCVENEGRYALSLSMNYFNHTVAPEPVVYTPADAEEMSPERLERRPGLGAVVGGFGWARRLPDAIQWRHSEAPDFAPDIASLALWRRHERAPTLEAAYSAIAEVKRESWRTATYLGVGLTRFWPLVAKMSGLRLPERLDELAWPAEDPNTFEVFGARVGSDGDGSPDQLIAEQIAVRKPSYYASFYTARANQSPGAYHERHLHIGGALTIWWTPSYGAGIVSTNWSEASLQGLGAVDADGVLQREGRIFRQTGGGNFLDTYGREHRYTDDDQRRVVDDPEPSHEAMALEGNLGLLSYRRDVTFEDDRMRVTLTLENPTASALSLQELYENFPVFHNPTGSRDHRKRARTLAVDQDGAALPEGDVSGLKALRVGFDEASLEGGFAIVFDELVEAEWTSLVVIEDVEEGQNDYPRDYKGQQHGALRVALASQWAPGERRTWSYTVGPWQPVDEAALKQRLSAMGLERQREEGCVVAPDLGGLDMGSTDLDMGTSPSPDLEMGSEMGAPDMSSGGSGGGPRGEDQGCGCTHSPASPDAPGALLLALGVLLGLKRQRGRARPYD